MLSVDITLGSVSFTNISILGNAEVGSTLSLSPVSLKGNSPMQYAAQWLRIDPTTAAETAIPGATGAEYITDFADVAYLIAAEVTRPDGTVIRSQNSVLVTATPRAPAWVEQPRIEPAGGPIGTVYEIFEGRVSAWPAPSLTMAFQLGATDVSGQIVRSDDGRLLYTSTAAGNLSLQITAANASGSVPSDLITASVAANVTSVTSRGVTWTFEGTWTVGTLSGDGRAYIVVPTGQTAKLLSTTPAETTHAGYLVNGAEVDPVAFSATQGYDQRTEAFKPNREWLGSKTLAYPRLMSPGQAIVKTVADPTAVLSSAGSRQGLFSTIAVCYVLPAAPAPGAGELTFGWAPVTWAGRPTPTLTYINVDALVAQLPTYSMTGISASVPNIDFHVTLMDADRPLFPQLPGATTGFGYQIYFPRGSAGQIGQTNYGLDLSQSIAGTPGLFLIADTTTAPTAKKKTLLTRLIRDGLDWWAPFKGTNQRWGANGGHYQFHHEAVLCAIWATGGDPAEIATYMPGNIVGQPFRWTQTMIDTKLAPHSVKNATVIPQYALTTVLAVSGNQVSLDGSVYWASKFVTGCRIKRVSDGASAVITSNTETQGSGASVNPTHTIAAQPTPPFAPGDQVYIAAEQTISVGDFDFATERSQRSFSVNADWDSYSTSWKSEYRSIAGWASQLLACVAMGLMDDPAFDAAIGYMETAAASNAPSSTNDFPHLFKASSSHATYAKQFAQAVYGAHWTAIKASRSGANTLTATIDPPTSIAALQDYVLYGAGAHLGLNAASIPFNGTVPGAPDGTTVLGRLVYYDDVTGIATGGSTAWTPLGVTAGEDYAGAVSMPLTPDVWAKREVRVQGSTAPDTQDTFRVAAGFTAAGYEQSNGAKTWEPKNWSTTTALDPAVVADPNALQVFAVDRNTGAVSRTRITSNSAEATSLSASVVAYANAFAAEKPGYKLAFAVHMQSSTSPLEMIRDRATAGARPARAWDDELALHQAFTSAGQKVDMVGIFGWVSFNTSGTNDDETLPIYTGKMADGSPVALGGAVDWSTGTAGAEYTLTHCLTELYDFHDGTSGHTKLMFVGPHGKSPSSADDLTVDPNPSNLDMKYEAIGSEWAARAASGLFPELYPTIWEDQGALRAYDDQLHHNPRVDEGEPKLARMMMLGMLQTAGLVSWPLPEFNRAFWAADGSYVDIWMDGRDVTTGRNHGGGTSTYIRGFTVDWVKATTAQLQANAGGSGRVGVRVTPPAGYVGPGTGVAGKFDYASLVSFGRGQLTGYRLWGGGAGGDLADANPYTLDLPGIAGLAPGMAVVPIQVRSMEKNAAFTANTLTAPPVFSTSGTQRFVSPNTVGNSGFSSPTKLRFYMKGKISNVGADQRLAAIGGWATITARSAGVVRVTGMSTGNHDHPAALAFGSNFTLMVTIVRDAITPANNRVDVTINNGTPQNFPGLTAMTAFPTAQLASLLAASGGGTPTTGTFERVAMWINDGEADPAVIPAAAGWFDASGNAATVSAAWAAWLTGVLS